MKQHLTPAQAEAHRLLKTAYLEVPSEQPPPEPLGHRERSGLATGWVPVSRVEALLEKWEAEASDNNWNGHYRAAQHACIADLRAEMERATERQPAPNNAICSTQLSHNTQRSA